MKNNNCLLPRLVRKDSSMTRSRQTVFGGLSSNPAASSQEIVGMSKLSPSAYPAIGTMESRFAYATKITGAPHGITYHGSLIVAQGSHLLSISPKGAVKILGDLQDSDKSFASFGRKLLILPDGVCYDTVDGGISPLSIDTDYLTNAALGVDYVTHGMTDWAAMGFAVGNGVEVLIRDYILGSVTTVTCKVKLILNNTLFLDHTFDLTGTYDICVRRPFPSMTHLCVVGDRLMGCSDNRIYVCEAGNPFNWSATEGEDGDPVTFETGDGGVFAACAAFRDSGIFFKEDHIYQLLGSGADDYVLSDLEAPGIGAEDGRSLCEVNGALYYLSPGGVFAYDGDYPQYIGEPLSKSLTVGVGGSDGVNYYLSATDSDGGKDLYAYHTRRKMWYVQDALVAASMAKSGEVLYIQTEAGELLRTKRAGEQLPADQTLITEAIPALPSLVEFGETFGNGSDGLRLYRLCLRVKGSAGAVMRVEIAYDGSDQWEIIDTIEGEIEGMVQLHPYPRRATSYRLRLSMLGAWQVYELICDCELGKQ